MLERINQVTPQGRVYQWRIKCDRCRGKWIDSTGEAITLAQHAQRKGWLVGLALVQIGKLDAPSICPNCRAVMEAETIIKTPPEVSDR